MMLIAGLLAETADAQSCVPPPGGMVGWWRAEGDATDSAGTNNGTITGGASLTTNGEAGEALLFNGINGYISIPAVDDALVMRELKRIAYLRHDSQRLARGYAAGVHQLPEVHTVHEFHQ